MNRDVEYLKKNLPESEWDKGIKLLNDGVPVQYIVGNVDFYGNIIKVNKNVLIPRFETELLVDKSIGYIRRLFNSKVRVIDVGTGSGCIAIALKKNVDCDVVGVDISYEALEVASFNAFCNDVDVSFFYSDMLRNVCGCFDVLISNPPYISYDEEIMDVVRDNEPSLALYAPCEGLYYYRELLSTCSRVLNQKFLICFEIGYKQALEVVNFIRKYLRGVNFKVEKDYSDRDRFVFIWN